MSNFMFSHNFSLADFVASCLTRAGAVIEPQGYALLYALLPEHLVPVLGKEELLLAFDYEVADETPGSIFITPGSPLLDALVRLALDYGRVTSLYWSQKLPTIPRSLEQKILGQLDFRHCRPPRIALTWVAENIYYGFYFRSIFRSFEKVEAITPVVIEGSQALSVDIFDEQAEAFFLLDQPDYSLPSAPLKPLNEIYMSAILELDRLVRQQAETIQQSAAKLREKELAKVRSYYTETKTEITRKLQATTEPRKKSLLEQHLKAALRDEQRRVKDLYERYRVQAEVELDHIVAYHLPCVFIRLNLQHKSAILEQTVIYNPLRSKLEPVVCPRCSKPTTCLIPTREGTFVCATCSA
ncbi:MAG: hypothetical protein ACPL5F_12940 [Moorellaceae bacterium]